MNSAACKAWMQDAVAAGFFDEQGEPSMDGLVGLYGLLCLDKHLDCLQQFLDAEEKAIWSQECQDSLRPGQQPFRFGELVCAYQTPRKSCLNYILQHFEAQFSSGGSEFGHCKEAYAGIALEGFERSLELDCCHVEQMGCCLDPYEIFLADIFQQDSDLGSTGKMCSELDKTPPFQHLYGGCPDVYTERFFVEKNFTVLASGWNMRSFRRTLANVLEVNFFDTNLAEIELKGKEYVVTIIFEESSLEEQDEIEGKMDAPEDIEAIAKNLSSVARIDVDDSTSAPLGQKVTSGVTKPQAPAPTPAPTPASPAIIVAPVLVSTLASILA
jgi:hypothetical protein